MDKEEHFPSLDTVYSANNPKSLSKSKEYVNINLFLSYVQNFEEVTAEMYINLCKYQSMDCIDRANILQG